MIGLFDTGHGGLTIYRALEKRFPAQSFVYLGDHAHAPYGTRSAGEIIAFTQQNVMRLFDMGCPLVLLACNTATAVAAKYLQQQWLPASPYPNNRVLGIIAPTVEAATGTPWAVTTPSGPHRASTEYLAVFGTSRTIQSDVYAVELRKRCPHIRVVQQICPALAGAIEAGADEAALDVQVKEAVLSCLAKMDGVTPLRAILGCTHFPIVEHLFQKYLPQETRILCQGAAVADALADYLARHPGFALSKNCAPHHGPNRFMTTGNPAKVQAEAARFLKTSFPFEALAGRTIQN